ncbi:DUF6716 putative glycosyltransferase [Demequina iriomotensis]|uniref:DUF6716 putative glycosyltransferase n=1 Tax=Demequina iriomotensis TaxID=1536641 RepID=UPI0007824958|nr:DUF6716 putative glycosyltransferase [Demequina iriomotensis]
MTDASAGGARRALVVADSDSYLKWAVTRAADLREGWDVEVVVVRNAVTPSPAQIASAVDGRLGEPPAVIGLDALAARLRAERPDLLLLACRGPLIELLLLDELGGERVAGVVATGIPGIWYPPTALGVSLRAGCDLLVVHSERERDAVAAMLPSGRLTDVGLASLLTPAEVGGAARPRVVFAPQALVPATVAQRRELLDGLVETARRHPELDVVVKLRGEAGEAQTHAEHAPFDALASDVDVPGNLVFARGPLREYLGECVGFVTVSSTAALEALDADVPVLILADFGVSADVINAVFEGSGLFGDLADLADLRFRRPDPAWLARNYFHAHDDWTEQVGRRLDRGAEAAGRVPDPLAGARSFPRRVRRRLVALGAEDRTWAGRAALPLRPWLTRSRGA